MKGLGRRQVFVAAACVLVLLGCAALGWWNWNRLQELPEAELAARSEFVGGPPVKLPVPWLEREFSGHYRKSAYRAAQHAISQRLLAPASAKFPPFEEPTITGGKGRFRIKGVVDSQNAFGAMLRSDFDLFLEFDGVDAWKVRVIQLKERNGGSAATK